MKSSYLIFVSLLFIFPACERHEGANLEGESEISQQIGDVMASIDEMGGASGAFSLAAGAMSASCKIGTWSSCTNNVITRTFGGCTIAGAIFNGTVELKFNDGTVDNTCSFGIGHDIERHPNFTITGPRGGVLTVSKTGSYGQRLARTSANTYTFSSDGIRRVISAGGDTLFDLTTATHGTPLAITGINRDGRVMTGGTLRVTDHLSQVTCDYTPSNVTWSHSCNCPVGGAWLGSCSDGRVTELAVTGCGRAIFTLGAKSANVSFDRCYDL